MLNKKYHAKDWSDHDIDYLFKHIEKPDVFFARKFGRTIGAVNQKRYQVGAYVHKNIHWDIKEVDDLRRDVESGCTDTEIAAKWGISVYAIRAARVKFLNVKYRAGRRKL